MSLFINTLLFTYSFSQSLNRWGLVRVGGAEYHSYVCKMRRQDVNFAAAIERNIGKDNCFNLSSTTTNVFVLIHQITALM